jgi:hypothetical protein
VSGPFATGVLSFMSAPFVKTEWVTYSCETRYLR